MFKTNKGVSTVEYAIIAAVVAGGVMAYNSAPKVGKGVSKTMCESADYMTGGDGTSCGTADRLAKAEAARKNQCEANGTSVWHSDTQTCVSKLTPQQQCAADGNYWETAGTKPGCYPGPAPVTAADYYTYNAKLCSTMGGTTITGNHLTGAYSCKMGATTYRLPGVNGAT